MYPVQSDIFRWPRALTLEPYRALQTHQMQKVAAVGLACILFLGVQFCYSWTIAVSAAFLCSAVTLIAEALLRANGDNSLNWINRDFNKKNFLASVALTFLVSAVFAFRTAPVQAITKLAINGNLRATLLVTVVAPIAEEILFRGFLQERFEALTLFFHHYVSPLSVNTQKICSVNMQAIIFGAMHITGNQVMQENLKLPIFLNLSARGAFYGYLKETDQSLISPIAIHAAQNTGIVLGFLLKQALR